MKLNKAQIQDLRNQATKLEKSAATTDEILKLVNDLKIRRKTA